MEKHSPVTEFPILLTKQKAHLYKIMLSISFHKLYSYCLWFHVTGSLKILVFIFLPPNLKNLLRHILNTCAFNLRQMNINTFIFN